MPATAKLPETKLPSLFEDDLRELIAGNLDAMAEHYHPDAQIMRLPDSAVAKGKKEIKAFFADYLSLDPEVEVLTCKQEDNCILYHSTVTINGESSDLVGTWVLRDGLIWRQTAVAVPR